MTLTVVRLLVPNGLKCCRNWEFHSQESLGFTKNGAKTVLGCNQLVEERMGENNQTLR